MRHPLDPKVFIGACRVREPLPTDHFSALHAGCGRGSNAHRKPWQSLWDQAT